jgi:hypothetical protein
VIDQLAQAKTPLVPQILVGGDGQRATLIDALMGNLLAHQLNGAEKPPAIPQPSGPRHADHV